MAKLKEPTITTQVEGDAAVILIHGRLTIGSRAEGELMAEIRKLLGSGVRRFVLDFKHVSRIDSSGVGELVATHRRIEQQGGEVTLQNLSSRLSEVHEITDLFDRF